jgi:WD40 repeat protein
MIASGDSPRIYDLSSERSSVALLNKSSASLAFSPDGEKLITHDEESLNIFDVKTGENVRNSQLSGQVELSPNGSHFLTKAAGTTKLVEANTGKTVLSFEARSTFFSLDGKYVAALTNNLLKILRVETGQEIFQESYEDLAKDLIVEAETINFNQARREALIRNSIEDSDFSVNNNKIYFLLHSESGNSAVPRLWNLTENKIVSLMDDYLSNAFLSIDGKYLVTNNRFNTIKIFNVVDGKEINHVQNDGGDSDSNIVFSADSKYLATVGGNNTVRVLEVSTGEEIYRLKDDNEPKEIAFSSDGRYIATVSNRVKLWSLETQSLIPALCSRLTHNFSLNEWRQIFGNEGYRETCSNLPDTGDLISQISSDEASLYNSASSNDSQTSPSPTDSQPLTTLIEPPSHEPQPSPSPDIAYQFPPFPQPTCGDTSTDPNPTWYPVFINNGNLEEIQRKYCADAYPKVRELTGEPAVQVASFTDPRKAEAFAAEVGGEVGQPQNYQQGTETTSPTPSP